MNELAEAGGSDTFGEMSGGGGENVAAMECSGEDFLEREARV